EVDGGEAQGGVAPAPAERDGRMGVALGREPGIAGPAIGGDRRRERDVPADEACEAVSRCIGHGGEPQPAEPAAAGLAPTALHRAGDLGLAGGTPAGTPRSGGADISLVGLDPSAQGLAAGPDHRPADLVQPGPGRLIAAETHLPLQLQGRDATLAGGDEVNREKPLRQAGLGLLENGSGEKGMLLAAGYALVDVAPRQLVGVIVPAGAAAEAVRPAHLEQMIPALLVPAEPGDERRQIPEQLVRQHAHILTGPVRP